MPREREFDASKALDRAVALFWRKGFNDTSMDDLVNETGVSRYGIYGTFGNKRTFFQAALARYAQQRTAHLQTELRKPDAGLEAIYSCFASLKDMAEGKGGQLGCLICNTATELGPHDANLAHDVRGFLNDLADAFQHALENAKDRKEINDSIDPKAYAFYLTGLIQGAAVLVRAGFETEKVELLFGTALENLQP